MNKRRRWKAKARRKALKPRWENTRSWDILHQLHPATFPNYKEFMERWVFDNGRVGGSAL